MALSIHKTGNVPAKVDKALKLIENKELHPVDIIADCGLSTIYAAASDNEQYNEEKYLDIDSLYQTEKDISSTVADRYKAVVNRFVSFAETEKSLIFIGDVLRHVVVNGKNKLALADKSKNFSKHIYWPFRHLTDHINTSYAAVYDNWAKVYDEGLERNTWIPMSGIIASVYCQSDAAYNVWSAPAGFDRGRVTNVVDVALKTNDKQRDQLYSLGINSVASFPNDGFVIFGQKTTLAKPSAFDRVNVRRLFLYLQKNVQQTVKNFVFEPNTYTTRSNVVSVLTPLFERAKNSLIQGIYDYKIVCDVTNNPPDVIDDNAMVVDIFIKPTRTAEFILVNFYATRTSQDFTELIS